MGVLTLIHIAQPTGGPNRNLEMSFFGRVPPTSVLLLKEGGAVLSVECGICAHGCTVSFCFGA